MVAPGGNRNSPRGLPHERFASPVPASPKSPESMNVPFCQDSPHTSTPRAACHVARPRVSGANAFRLLAALATGIVLSLCTGCDDSPEAEPVAREEQNPFVGRHVIVSLPKGFELRTRWELPADEWATRTGATVELREHEPASPEFSEGAAVQLFPLEQFAELAATGQLDPLPESLRDDPRMQWLDVFPGLREQQCQWNGKPVAVPLAAPVLLLAYRADLLEAAGRQPPRTWQEYAKLVRELPDWAPGMTAVEPWDATFRSTMFLARAVCYARHPANYSVFFDIRTGEPLIGGPPFVRALETSLAMIETIGPETLKRTPDDCLHELLAGRAAIGIVTVTGPLGGQLPFAAATATDAETETPGDNAERRADSPLSFLPLPGAGEVYNPSTHDWEPPVDGIASRTTLTGFAGTFAAIAKNSPEELRQPAWNLLLTLTGEEQLAGTVPLPLRGLVRDSQTDLAAAWLTGVLTPGEAESAVRATGASLRTANLVPALPVTGRKAFLAALTQSLEHALEGKLTPETALKNAAEQWNNAFEWTSRETVRDSYRQSMGLRPLSR